MQNLKSFATNISDQDNNPFSNHISDEQYAYMIEQGFKKGTLDCYADLTGNICYRKSMICSLGWVINMYITENGMALDHDYDCGGNSSNRTWWFDDGTYTMNEFDYKTYKYLDVEHKKFADSFEEAWNEMLEEAMSL